MIYAAHILSSRPTEEQLRRLRAAGAERIFVAGAPFPGSASDEPPCHRIRGWFGLRDLGRGRLLDAIADRTPRGELRNVVAHVWDERALGWVIPVANQFGGVIIEHSGDSPHERIARWIRVAPRADHIRIVSDTQTARREMIARGVQPDHAVVIPPAVDFGEIQRIDRAALRAELGLSDEHRLVVPARPLVRASGAIYAAWATLLVAQVNRCVRFLIENREGECRRIGNLIHSARHGQHICRPPRPMTLAESVVIADVVLLPAEGPMPMFGLAWAMAAARPILASAIPAMTEYLAHDQNARLAQPGSPKDVARRMLEIIDAPEKMNILTQTARDEAFAAFSRQKQMEAYREVMKSLESNAPAVRPTLARAESPASP